MISSLLPRTAGLALVLLAATALPSLALDGDDFATKLNAAYAAQGGKVTFSAIDIDGDDITLKDARFVPPGQPGFEIGDLMFDDVSETGDGGYRAEQVRVPNIDTTKDGTRVQMANIRVDGMIIPADTKANGVDNILFYDRFSMGPMTVSKDNVDVFKLASTEAEVTRLSGDAGYGFDMTANGIVFDVAGMEDPKSRKTLGDLGYDTISGSMKVNGTWELEDGRMHLPEYSLTLDDIGRLNMMIDISGYTLEFVKALGEAQKADDQAKGLMMMGMMQQLTFNAAEIDFADASLTGRILDYVGKQQGVSGEQMAQAAKGMLPLVVGQLGIPALQAQIVAAANAYLDNPENLTVTARPEKPVPFSQIMGAGMGDPRQLVDLLNVEITANE